MLSRLIFRIISIYLSVAFLFCSRYTLSIVSHIFIISIILKWNLLYNDHSSFFVVHGSVLLIKTPYINERHILDINIYNLLSLTFCEQFSYIHWGQFSNVSGQWTCNNKLFISFFLCLCVTFFYILSVLLTFTLFVFLLHGWHNLLDSVCCASVFVFLCISHFSFYKRKTYGFCSLL